MTAGTLPLRGGGHLSYEVRGEGPPLLLLRPLGGSIVSWLSLVDMLEPWAKVISLDHRGTGLSSEAPLGLSTRQLAEDALALLDHLGVSSALVYGISLGGMVASWLAVDAPARVRRLVLASTLPRGLMIRSVAWQRGVQVARCLLRSPAEAEACVATAVLTKEFRELHPEEVRRIQDAARARPTSHRSLVVLLGAAATHDVRARLSSIRCPVLVLVGQRDPFLTLVSQRTLLREIPDTTYEVIRGAGHDVSAEAPDEVAAHLLRLLRAPA